MAVEDASVPARPSLVGHWSHVVDQVQLPGTGRLTSNLGMGTGRLMTASTGRRESLALLETAFDAGIRHFDTAPSYGGGEAEACLGEFLSRHRTEVTITTKYGIPPSAHTRVIAIARAIAGRLRTQIPGFKAPLQNAQSRASANRPARVYSAAGARETLDLSLRTLKVDRIDLWLLHEPAAEDLQNSELLRFMEDAIRAGKIGAFGVGSESGKVPAILAGRSDYCPVIQCEWDPLLSRDLYSGHFTIFHNVFRNWPEKLAVRFNQDSALCQTWSHETGISLEAPGVLNALLLKAALLQNHGGIILFFSKKKRNIVENVRVASDTSLVGPAQSLLRLLQREAPHILA